MKVSEIINRIEDIEKCQDLLKDWLDDKIRDPEQIEAIADSIDLYLEAYVELLKNKEVK